MTEPGNITVTLDVDGVTRDITEHVKLLYDTVLNSMDWGSGFLDDEEMARIIQVGAACGFANNDQVAIIANLESQYPEAPPERVPNHGASDVFFASYSAEWSAWATRRKEWVKSEAIRRYGNPPTWESMQTLLDDVTKKFDTV